MGILGFSPGFGLYAKNTISQPYRGTKEIGTRTLGRRAYILPWVLYSGPTDG